MKKATEEVVVYLINSVLMAIRWMLLTLVVVLAIGLGLRTWRSSEPRVVEHRLGGVAPLTAEQAGALEDRMEGGMQ